MKILRSVNRRDFSIEPAGFFNVLKPNKRFNPARSLGEFRYLASQSKATAFPQTPENPATAPPFHLVPPPDQNHLGYHGLLQPVLITFGAIVLSLFLVWWSAGCPIHITF